jgi:hypothetical protein
MERRRSFFRWRNINIALAALVLLVAGLVFGPIAVRGPQIVSITPADGTKDANPQGGIQIVFSQWVRPDSVRAAVRFEPPVDFTVNAPSFPRAGASTVTIEPQGGLRYGAAYRLQIGGAVQNLPTHTFPTDDGGVDMKCPTEIAIDDRREAELAKNGFMPLVHRKNSDFAAFIGAQSLQKPAEYDDPDATANANLAARLPYLFATCRFAHYLKAIVRDKIGSFKERDDVQRWLQNWILNYVDGDPAHSSESTKARKPLAAAEVVVEEVEGNPGYYTSKFFLRPHYQLEGLTVSLRLVSKLPSAKAA